MVKGGKREGAGRKLGSTKVDTMRAVVRVRLPAHERNKVHTCCTISNETESGFIRTAIAMRCNNPRFLWNEVNGETVWERKYAARLADIVPEFFDPSEHIAAGLSRFTGTVEEQIGESERLAHEAVEIVERIRQDYINLSSVIFKEYVDDLLEKYKVRPKIFTLAYEAAFELGRHAGSAEVEAIFAELVGPFIEAYQYGAITGKESRHVGTVEYLAQTALRQARAAFNRISKKR